MCISFDEYTLLSYIFPKSGKERISIRDYTIFVNELIKSLNKNKDKNPKFKYCSIIEDHSTDDYVKEQEYGKFFYLRDDVCRCSNGILNYKQIENKYDKAYNSDIVSKCLKKAYKKIRS